MDVSLLVAVFFALGIVLVFFGIDLMLSGRQVELGRRLSDYRIQPTAAPTQDQVDKPKTERLEGLAPTGLRRQIATELARADIPLTVSEYILVNVMLVVVAFFGGYVLFEGNLILSLLLGILAFLSPRGYVFYLQRKRLQALDSQLGDALLLLANSLRAGYGLLQTIETVAREVAPPLSTEFGRVSREISLGLSIEAALANLVRRNPSLDLEMVVTAINVQHEVGGNLSEILDKTAGTIRERVRIAGEVRTLTAQQRFSATILTFFPLVVGVVLYAINPSYISLLWQNSCGLMLVGIGVFLMIVGFVLIRRIMTIRF